MDGVSLTAISLVPPLISGADAATIAALIGLHLVAAAVMIPTLARSLRAQQAQAEAATVPNPERWNTSGCAVACCSTACSRSSTIVWSPASTSR